MPQPLIAGWREIASLPDWGVKRIIAKLDSGARTSSLHVENLEELPGDRVAFDIVPNSNRPERRRRVEAELHRMGRIKPTSGQIDERPVVLTTIRIGPVEREIELSLSARDHMRFPMLIGRTALAGALLVDSSRRYVLTARTPKPTTEDAHS